MRVRKQFFGYVEVDEQRVRIRGLVGDKTILLERITSVSANRLTGQLLIETGAQIHRIGFWRAAHAVAVKLALDTVAAH